MSRFIPYGRQYVDNADIAGVNDALTSDWLTQVQLVQNLKIGS